MGRAGLSAGEGSPAMSVIVRQSPQEVNVENATRDFFGTGCQLTPCNP